MASALRKTESREMRRRPWKGGRSGGCTSRTGGDNGSATDESTAPATGRRVEAAPRGRREAGGVMTGRRASANGRRSRRGGDGSATCGSEPTKAAGAPDPRRADVWLGIRVTRKFRVGLFGFLKFRVLKNTTRNLLKIIKTRHFGYPIFRVPDISGSGSG